MALSELDVLYELDDSARANQDQWPEFSLKNVKVFSQETGKMASLLTAHGKNLLRVEGQLSDIDPSYAEFVKSPKYRNRTIRIDDVALYSFSQYQDGSLGFWAAGKAGWYEISSATPRYLGFMEGMNEATGMFYYLADKYRNSRSKLLKEPVKTRDAHVRHLMNDYANSDYCKRLDNDDIREGFAEHRNFLLKSMLEGQEGLEWETAPIFRHLKKAFPSDFRIMRSIVLGENVFQNDEDTEIDEEPPPKATRRTKARSHSNRSKPLAGTKASEILDEEDEASDSGLTTPPQKGKRKSYLRPRSERSAKRFSRYDTRATRSQDVNGDDVEMIDGLQDDASDRTLERIPSALRQTRLTETLDAERDSAATAQKAPMPSYYEPRGPGDTWTCPYDGCNHKIWDAASQQSIELMKAHFNDTHANTMEALINSESRPWANVSHLLQRVKGFATANAQGNRPVLKDKALPERIVRRY